MESARPMDAWCAVTWLRQDGGGCSCRFQGCGGHSRWLYWCPLPYLLSAFPDLQGALERLALPGGVSESCPHRCSGKGCSERLAEGEVNILIGTHRILGKDVKFKDLGLLIIDEEQKFGVSVKEKLRQLKVNVDTLTMTATPIPRTLQFSLMGARDLSVIQTPPLTAIPSRRKCTPSTRKSLPTRQFEMSRNGRYSS